MADSVVEVVLSEETAEASLPKKKRAEKNKKGTRYTRILLKA